MGHFNKFGGDRGGHKQMFQAICSKCGQNCEVPFKPTGDRPVFCNSCFKSQGGPAKHFAQKSFGAPAASASAGGITKEQFNLLNSKLDKILGMLNAARPAKAEAPAAVKKDTEAKKNKAAKKAKAPAKKATKSKKK